MNGAKSASKIVLQMSLFCMQVHCQLSTKLEDTFDCSTGSNQDLFFIVGSNFSLFCRLGPQFCSNATKPGDITWEEPASHTVTMVDTCLVRLDVVNVSKEDQGWYLCGVKNETYCSRLVLVYDKLPAINITKFVCTSDKMMTVTFDRGVLQDENVTYTVTMIESDASGVSHEDSGERCSGIYSKHYSSGTMCKPQTRECVCQYSYPAGSRYSLPRDTNVRIVVTENRPPHQILSTTMSFSILDHIVPGPPTLNDPAQVTTSDATISWCADRNTQACIHYSNQKHTPILYQVLVYKNEGIQEQLSVTIPTGRYYCLEIRLTNLTAFTRYSVLSSLSGGGGQGNETRTDFTTSMSVPTYPPNLGPYSFLRSTSAIDGKSTPVIIIMWQPLPQEARGGGNLTYLVQVMSLSGFNQTQTVTEANAFFASQLLTTNLTVRIWAQNVEGCTESYSELQVPPIAETRTTLVHVEFDGQVATVYVHLDDAVDVAELGFHVCYNYTDTKVPGISICQEQPVTAFITGCVEKTNKFEINLTTTTENQEITETAVLQYRQEITVQKTREYHQTNATLTTYRPNSHTFRDCQANADIKPGSLAPGSIQERPIENTARRKRFLPSEIRGDLMGGLRRLTRDTQTVSNSGDNSRHDYPVVFISVLTQDEKRGQTGRGLIPADCYFDRQAHEVQVDLKDIMADESGISLRWKQTCDGKQAGQFRADYFCVTEDGNCDQDECRAQQYNNTIDQENTIYVARSTNFIYFHAYTHDGNHGCSKRPEVGLQYSVNDKSSTGTSPLVVAFAVAGSVVLVATVLCVGVCFWRKKDLKNKGKILQLPDTSENLTVDVSTNSPNDAIDMSELDSSESGRSRGSGSDRAVARPRDDGQLQFEQDSATDASSRSNTSHAKRTTERRGDNGRKEEAAYASGHTQTSDGGDRDDGASCSRGPVCSGGSSEHQGHGQKMVEDEQQKAFQQAGFSFNSNTSGHTQTSDGGDTGSCREYSRSVIYSGGSNEGDDVVVVEEEELAKQKSCQHAGLSLFDRVGQTETSDAGNSDDVAVYCRGVVHGCTWGDDKQGEMKEEEEEEEEDTGGSATYSRSVIYSGSRNKNDEEEDVEEVKEAQQKAFQNTWIHGNSDTSGQTLSSCH